MCGYAVLLCLVLPMPPTPVVVDVVEVNNVVDPGTGCVRLEQVVWWDWCGWCCRYEVRDWRFLDRAGWPRLTESGWRNEWRDDSGMVAVTASVRRETWTWYDVEVEDRRTLPEQQRRKIRIE